jgi:uncharacterized protein (DUF362 family)
METDSPSPAAQGASSITTAQRVDNRVAITLLAARYPEYAPYHPSTEYPEYPFRGHKVDEPNLVYDAVRTLLRQLDFDRNAFGTTAWNPLASLIEPGMTVVLKPNLVLSRHKDGKNLYSIITHPAVLRSLMDYCWIALRGKGKIIIADAPQYDCDFQELLSRTGLEHICRFFNHFDGPDVSYLDLRLYWSPRRHFSSMLQPLAGDPCGSLKIDLGKRSALFGQSNAQKLYGAAYHRDETIRHHTGATHVYELSRTIMTADVVISVPKLKVHKKVGVTLNAKGLVGVATNKNLIVHYTLGTPQEGGDQFPDDLLGWVERRLIKTERWMYDHFLAPRRRSLEYIHRFVYWLHNHTTRKLGLKVAENKRQLDAGNWHGNDTAWRMTVDLMRLFYFADSHGHLHTSKQRRMFSLIDGVIGGEACGPLTPDPKPAGVLIAGANLLAVDLVAARLMGFDPLRLKVYSSLLRDWDWDFGLRSLKEVTAIAGETELAFCLARPGRYLDFRPHPGWTNHIEL